MYHYRMSTAMMKPITVEDLGSDASSSESSPTILRKRLQDVASFPRTANNKIFYQIDNLHRDTTNRPVFSFNGSANRERRSRSIVSPSAILTRRHVARKTMSSKNLLTNTTLHSNHQVTTTSSQRNTSQGVQLYERRRSAVPKLDKSGNISYLERKNMRRGSLLVAQQISSRYRQIAHTGEDVDILTIDEINISDMKRQSLQIPSHLGRRRKSSAGETILSAESASDYGTPLAANLNRRRRSRAPESLARDIELMMPKSNPEARERLAWFFRVVKVCVSLCNWSYTRAEEKKESFLGFAQVDSEEHNIEKLFFNPSYFKANRQLRLTEDTKRILTLASWKRTKEQIRYVQIALRNIRAFAEYPLEMQYKLSRVGWLEEYGPKRAILRQGHLPDAFYFIITGTLVVTVLDLSKGKPMAQTVAFLKRGDSFGELAILNNTRRASTVITKDTVQLLCISVEDFEDIFMLAGGMKSVSDPTRNTFIRNLNMFQHWPIEQLADHPQDCLFHFFKFGDVLVKDSQYSDWIYIVKSGSCSVLKKLKRTPPKIPSKLRRQTPAMIWNKGNQLGLVCASPSSLSLPKPSKKRSMLRRRHSWPTTNRLRPSKRSTSSASTNVVRKVTFTKRETSEKKAVMSSNGANDQSRSQSQTSHKYDQASGDSEDIDEHGIPKDFVANKRTFHSDLDAPKMPTETTDADLDPVFIVVEVLNRGAVFGLHGSVFTDQPNLSVVSNGAECILIRKRFYLEHASDQTFGFLRRQETPYPSNAELQEKLQVYRNWNSYRNHTLKQAVYETRAHKQQRLLAAT
ncbi:uncharacterized protein [Amphiura filiformis]|uniref:uncharacterized protein n=1 Tax=Amphiura filiformis TaxID=82378 RepID=UPI003B2173DD